ncbi:p24 [Hemileuca sp. nucleopolyhedrovirus]|uniref:p24 n=1 Tax=Hemileuca sp. nucleopolyhedrovirus TaxID=1367203 RepID=S5MK78_9ABAC|nr:p24 [Hemileuca sp. nucleopolyhedrovirus]AGR56871.1 p24 [Hemileuca sp. nucleopolyhedrovirus]
MMYENSNNTNNNTPTNTINNSFSSSSSIAMSSSSATLPSESKNTQHFQYEDETIEVVIIENGEDDRDGYVEITSATKLVSPIVTIRGFNKAVLWTNAMPFQKLTRNNKNYVHVFALCKYLSMYNLSSNSVHPPQYYVLKRLICDLIIGAQSQVIDPIDDIKNQLCTLQQCINNGIGNGNVMAAGVYQPTTVDTGTTSANNNWTEYIRDMLRYENSSLLTNITTSLDNIKSLQIDLANKLAFSNDTMLDSFKSIKDIIIRKK